jgi:tetratricopeptide (TPR) repeat protein
MNPFDIDIEQSFGARGPVESELMTVALRRRSAAIGTRKGMRHIRYLLALCLASLACASAAEAEEAIAIEGSESSGRTWVAGAASIWKVRGKTKVAAGYGTGPTSDEAARDATARCQRAGGTNCKVLGPYNSGCFYVTVGSNRRGVSWGSGATQERASEGCSRGGYTCKTPSGGCVTEITILRTRPLAAESNEQTCRNVSSEPDLRIKACSKLIDREPTDASVYAARAWVYLDNKQDYNHAIGDFTTAIDLVPGSASYRGGRGIAYSRNGDAERALADLNAAIEADPTLAIAYRNRAAIHETKKDIKSAIADYRQALSVDPADSKSREQLERLGANPGTPESGRHARPDRVDTKTTERPVPTSETAQPEVVSRAREHRRRQRLGIAGTATEPATESEPAPDTEFAIEPVNITASSYFARRSRVPVRERASEKAPAVTTLADGERVQVIGKTRNSRIAEERWYQIELAGGKSGFVIGKDLHSQTYHNAKLRYRGLTSSVDEVLDRAQKSTGDLAGHLGFYSLGDTCTTAPEPTKRGVAGFEESRKFHQFLANIRWEDSAWLFWTDGTFIYRRSAGDARIFKFKATPLRSQSYPNVGSVAFFGLTRIDPSGTDDWKVIGFADDGKLWVNVRFEGKTTKFASATRCSDLARVREALKKHYAAMIADLGTD